MAAQNIPSSQINFLRAKDLPGIQTMLYPRSCPISCESVKETKREPTFQILAPSNAVRLIKQDWISENTNLMVVVLIVQVVE